MRFNSRGSTRTDFKQIIWKADAPMKCKIFSWLAVLNRCLTADNLAKRGWPHNASCSLCQRAPENASHMLASCPFTTELWRRLLSRYGLPATLAPSATTANLLEWWEQSRSSVPRDYRRGWSSLVQLVWWTAWKERNARIFDNKFSTVMQVFHCLIEDIDTWTIAGRNKINKLLHRPLEPD